MAQQPAMKFRVGNVSAAIWENEVGDQGQERVQRSVRVQTRYWDNSKKLWRDSDYWFRDDLPRVQFVVQKAYEYIALKEDEEGRAPTVAV